MRLSTVTTDPVTGEARLKPHMTEEMSRIVNLPLLRATKEGDLDLVDHLLEVGCRVPKPKTQARPCVICWRGCSSQQGFGLLLAFINPHLANRANRHSPLLSSF